MKKIFITILFIFISSFCFADTTTVNKDVGSFNSIYINYPGTVYIKQGDSDSLTIVGNEDRVKYVSTDVKSNILLITDNRNWFERVFTMANSMTFYITVRDLNSITNSGFDNFVVTTPVNVNSLSIDLRGYGDFVFEHSITVNALKINCYGDQTVSAPSVTSKTVTLNISGKGKISFLSGSTDSQSISISGLGEYNAYNFLAQSTTAECSGASRVRVNTSRTLNVETSGACDVSYVGKPVITKLISGAGKVEPR